MRKFVFYAAALAAMITVTSCSSDDDVVATAPAEPLPQGTPLSVRVVDGTTRADLSKTTTEGLASFKLYGIQQTSPTTNFWLDGAIFNGGNTAGWTCTSNPTWPTDNKETATSFYGYADGSTIDGEVTGLTPSIASDAQSFHFTLGEGESSTQYWSVPTLPTALRNNQKSVATVFKHGKYNTLQNLSTQTWSVASSENIDNNLPDLLVTDDNSSAVEGTDGKLNLTFNHALSSLVIKAYLVSSTNLLPTYTFCLEWIRVRNLYTSGTYTFGTGWTFDSNTDKKIAYEKSWGEGTPKTIKVQDAAVATSKDKIKLTTLVGPGEFMVIPQTYESYTSTGDQNTATAINPDTEQKCFIELYGYVTTNAAGNKNFTSNDKFLPLTITGLEFKPGKQHTIVLDLSRILNDKGVYVATPSAVIVTARQIEDFSEE
ncbi:MAG: hypothetical protein IJ551_11890 [Prevotella sp.]|nr:hypothetical protein [Prevotella sp.]